MEEVMVKPLSRWQKWVVHQI